MTRRSRSGRTAPPPPTAALAHRHLGRARRSAILIGLGAVMAALVACGAHESDASIDAPTGSPTDTGSGAEQLSVHLSDRVAEGDQVASDDLTVDGAGDPEASLLTENGGRLVASTDPDVGPALEFPTYVASEEAPTAIVSVTSKDQDWLQPGRESFRFGVDVTLDAQSSGTHHDNGDNLLQRGLFVDPTQLKLQADHHHPSCLVRGDEGMVLVISPQTLDPGVWYRLTCERDGDSVAVTVARLADGQPKDPQTTRKSGEIGVVEFPVDAPVSIGGKLGPDRLPAAATDQLNGSLARAFIDIGPAQ